VTLEDLRSELRAILFEEEKSSVDWPAVQARCLELGLRVHREWHPTPADEPVLHYLDDPDIRKKDRRFAEWQRDQLRNWLDTRAAG
jgi:hypothetical protein